MRHPVFFWKTWEQMHIISFIEKILRPLGLWDIRNHDPPQPATSESIPDLVYDFSDSQNQAVNGLRLYHGAVSAVKILGRLIDKQAVTGNGI